MHGALRLETLREEVLHPNRPRFGEREHTLPQGRGRICRETERGAQVVRGFAGPRREGTDCVIGIAATNELGTLREINQVPRQKAEVRRHATALVVVEQGQGQRKDSSQQGSGRSHQPDEDAGGGSKANSIAWR